MPIALLGIIAALVALVASKKGGDVPAEEPVQTETDAGHASTPLQTTTGSDPRSADVQAESGVDATGNPLEVVRGEGLPTTQSGSTSTAVSDFGTHPMRTDGGGIPTESTRPSANVGDSVQAKIVQAAHSKLPPREYARQTQQLMTRGGIGY